MKLAWGVAHMGVTQNPGHIARQLGQLCEGTAQMKHYLLESSPGNGVVDLILNSEQHGRVLHQVAHVVQRLQ